MIAVAVFGPTASGKSALALGLADALGGTVINADAMQCYRELSILTARPSPQDEARAPHRLYGTRAATAPGTAASWRAEALAEIERAHAAGRLPILCGGTGLYLEALVRPLADIPAIGAAARGAARGLLESLGAAGLHAWLARRDAATAARLRASDGQRLARAAEVWLETGRGLAAWQQAPAPATDGPELVGVRLDPPRAVLATRIAARFDAMIDLGALDEVRALSALHLDPSLPLCRAHGVRELADVLAGRSTLAQARSATLAATRAYTRRQATWFRHRAATTPERTVLIDTEQPLSAQQMQTLEHIQRILCL